MATAYQTLSDTERALNDQLLAQSRAADEWEGYRNPHATRIVAVADALARSFHLAPQDRAALRLAALAHDLGILVMRRDYIRRSGPLTLEEQLDLARHPIIGEQEVARLGAPRAVQLIVRWHHEAWNGMGYPDMLQREQIPLAARILRAADSYVSLTDDRPYRPARTEKDALRLMIEGAGLDFDPSVVQALVALDDLAELRSHARASMPAREVPLTVFQPNSMPVAQIAARPEEHAEPSLPKIPEIAAPEIPEQNNPVPLPAPMAIPDNPVPLPALASIPDNPPPPPPVTAEVTDNPPPPVLPPSAPPPAPSYLSWSPPAASAWFGTDKNTAETTEAEKDKADSTHSEATTEDFWK